LTLLIDAAPIVALADPNEPLRGAAFTIIPADEG
jgi:hypothetical protein